MLIIILQNLSKIIIELKTLNLYQIKIKFLLSKRFDDDSNDLFLDHVIFIFFSIMKIYSN